MTNSPAPTIEVFRGQAIVPHLTAVATLRQTVFRAFPYLYEGDADYEQRYLAAYAASPDSVFVLAFDGGAVVGASTGLPLAQDDAAFQAPFRARGWPVADVFYFGESVVLPTHRGRGLGHAFFDAREAHARALGGFRTTAFCAVDRADDDPRRPADYRPNDAFWRKRGYARQPGMTMRLAWRKVGSDRETGNDLTFWLRRWEVA
jgi:GNAT superfamily N-acetyltransferase